MAKNNRTKKQSKALAIFAVILALLLIAAAGVGAFGWVRAGKFEEQLKALKPSTADNGSQVLDNGLIVGEQTGNKSRMTLKVAPMPLSDDGDELVKAEQGYVFEAVVEGAGNTVTDFTYSATWKNASSSWADGKDVSDYVTLTVDSTNPRKATVTPSAPFGEPIIVTCTYDFDDEISVSRQLDYLKQIEGGQPAFVPDFSIIDIESNYGLIFDLEYGVGTIQGNLENVVAYWEFENTTYYCNKITNSQYYQTWYENTVKDGVHCGALSNKSCFIEYDENNSEWFYIDILDYIDWQDKAAYDSLYKSEYNKYLAAAFQGVGSVGVDITMYCSYTYNGVEICTYSDCTNVTVDFGTLNSPLLNVSNVSWANGGSGSVVFY